MKRRIKSASAILIFAMAAAFAAAHIEGCASLKEIPAFNPTARLLNKVASIEELETEVNAELGRLRDEGVLTQAGIDKSFTPSINKAEQIWKATRAIARGQPTDPPQGTLDDAKSLLISVRDVLTTIEGSRK